MTLADGTVATTLMHVRAARGEAGITSIYQGADPDRETFFFCA